MRALAQASGVHWNTILRIENGTTTGFQPSTVTKLAAALQVEPESLIDWEDTGAGKSIAA
jgi:DNA-binding Xre family transcriptional regulator